MLTKIFGSILHGVEAFRITIEVNIGKGLGYFITGQPDVVVRESPGRVEVAVKGLGFQMPRTKLTINLSPAHLRKTGAGFDLPIAVGILLATRQVMGHGLQEEYIMVGELALDGSVLAVKGALSMASQAKADGMKGIILPRANVREALLVDGIKVVGVAHLKELLEFIGGKGGMEEPAGEYLMDIPDGVADSPDFQDVRGQENVKRGLEIAAAGGHNILLYGPLLSFHDYFKFQT